MNGIDELVSNFLVLDPNMQYLYKNQKGEIMERLEELPNRRLAFKHFDDNFLIFNFYNSFGKIWLHEFVPFSQEYMPSFVLDKDEIVFKSDVLFFRKICLTIIRNNLGLLSLDHVVKIRKEFIENISLCNYLDEGEYYKEKIQKAVLDFASFCKREKQPIETALEINFEMENRKQIKVEIK